MSQSVIKDGYNRLIFYFTHQVYCSKTVNELHKQHGFKNTIPFKFSNDILPAKR